MKSNFFKDLNPLNISEIPHLTVVNILIYKSPQLNSSLLLPLLLIR